MMVDDVPMPSAVMVVMFACCLVFLFPGQAELGHTQTTSTQEVNRHQPRGGKNGGKRYGAKRKRYGGKRYGEKKWREKIREKIRHGRREMIWREKILWHGRHENGGEK
jgi:hypothetical protein